MSRKPIALNPTDFFHDGRGPELRQMIWGGGGTWLYAIEYLNPDWTSEGDLRHVLFRGMQVAMVTPEEVIGYAHGGTHFADLRPAAMVDLGRDAWLQSFAETHLAKCTHIQMLFYDELVDVICEDAACGVGPAPMPPVRLPARWPGGTR